MGEGVLKFSVEIFLSHGAEKFGGEQPFCAVFQRFSGNESLKKRGVGSIRSFRGKILSHSSEKIW